MKVDKAFVLYANEAYYDVVSMAVKSINNVSDIPVIVYMMNSSKSVYGATVTIPWSLNSVNTSKKDYIDRSDPNIYKLLIQRPAIILDALDKYADTVAYIDSDTVVTKKDVIDDKNDEDCIEVEAFEHNNKKYYRANKDKIDGSFVWNEIDGDVGEEVAVYLDEQLRFFI